MYRITTWLLCILLLLPGLIPAVQAQSSSCENGECVPRLIEKLEDLGALYKRECLGKNTKNDQVNGYLQSNGLSESCWRYLTEVNHLEQELLRHQNRLESRLGCDSKDCKTPASSLNGQLNSINTVKNQLSCTPSKKNEIRRACPQDLNCALVSSALGIGGPLAEMLVPQKMKPKGCHLGNDSCATNLAMGFLRSTFTFFKGAWDLLKMAGNKIKTEMKEFWNWVSGAEKHSSTAQLAMAQASKDPGVFDALLKDFPGTMKKIWQAFVAALNDWLKTKVFCQKWSGTPQFSQCLKPTENFDCVSCKAMVNGLCTVTGTIVAEVVPAFLSGGMVTAVKYGVSGASRISRLFKVSTSGLNSVKRSRIGQSTLQASTQLDEALRVSRGLQATKVAVQASLSAISKYLLSPTRRLLKSSYTSLTNAAKKSQLFLAETATGKVLVFSGNAVKTSLRVVLYPIDNPMTALAYRSGARSFNRVFNLGTPRIPNKTLLVASAVQKHPGLETLIARREKLKMGDNLDSAQLIKIEEEILQIVSPERTKLLDEVLYSEETKFLDVIENLYPELQYGPLARKLSPEQVISAEEELFKQVMKIPDGPVKDKWTTSLRDHMKRGESRRQIVGERKNPFELYDESPLNVQKGVIKVVSPSTKTAAQDGSEDKKE